MNRIVEAFTKGHCQLTAIDDIIIAAVIVSIFVIVACVYFLIASIVDK